jgi:hypothetical protein
MAPCAIESAADAQSCGLGSGELRGTDGRGGETCEPLHARRRFVRITGQAGTDLEVIDLLLPAVEAAIETIELRQLVADTRSESAGAFVEFGPRNFVPVLVDRPLERGAEIVAAHGLFCMR